MTFIYIFSYIFLRLFNLPPITARDFDRVPDACVAALRALSAFCIGR